MVLPDLTLETIQNIVDGTLPDEVVEALVWRSLGHRYDPTTATWDDTAVPEAWRDLGRAKFIESRPATVKLTRAIPPAHKQLLKEQLGFAGYQVHELTPTKTRRATAANWLLSCLAREAETTSETMRE